MNICENCCEKLMCEQVKYDCPLMDFKGTTYRFNNSKGDEFIGQFKTVEQAKDFSYHAGLCFLGRL